MLAPWQVEQYGKYNLLDKTVEELRELVKKEDITILNHREWVTKLSGKDVTIDTNNGTGEPPSKGMCATSPRLQGHLVNGRQALIVVGGDTEAEQLMGVLSCFYVALEHQEKRS